MLVFIIVELQNGLIFIIAMGLAMRQYDVMPASENQHDIDIARVNQRAQEIEDKLPRLRQWMEHGKVMLELIKDYTAGRYREVPYWAISAIALALLYVLNPADVIPDMILGVGYLDDATVVAFCLKLIEKELARYTEWKAARTTQKSDEGKPPPQIVKGA